MAQFVGIAIQPHNDIEIDATGNLVLVYDAEAVGQHIRQRLMFWKREWFLNQNAGVDWLRYVLGRPPSEIGIAEAVFKREILQTPGVTEILELSVSYDRGSRGFIVDRCQVLTVFDEAIDINL